MAIYFAIFYRSIRLLLGVAITLAVLCLPAASGWRENIGTFRIGLVEAPGRAGADFEPLITAFSKSLDLPVEVFLARDYGALIDAQASGRIDYAVYSAMAFATAWSLCECVEPLVAPVSVNGMAGMRSTLIMRAGEKQNRKPNEALRIAVGTEDSVTGYLLPKASLEAGTVPLGGREYEIVQVRTAEEAVSIFAGGEVDGLFGWTDITDDTLGPVTGGTLRHLQEKGMADIDIAIVWSSGRIRFGPHAVRRNLDGEPRRRLLTLLESLYDKHPDAYDLLEPLHHGGFHKANQEDYRPLIFVVESIARQTRIAPAAAN